MVPADSPLLQAIVYNGPTQTAISNLIIQEYVRNELTWFDGAKFDLRFYWVVASVDPLIVLYHDGIVRVGEGVYNETDFSSNTQHLTNSAQNGNSSKARNITEDSLWRRIREHYHENQLSNIPDSDPIRHVRNQMKHAISTTVEAFREKVFFAPSYSKAENFFGLYGADFIIDANLKVVLTEMQAGPDLHYNYGFQKRFYQELLRPIVYMLEELTTVQPTNARANLLPLVRSTPNMGAWEVIHLGDEWRYQYERK